MPGFLFFAPANFAAGNFRIFDASCRQGHNDGRLTQAAASNGRRWRRSIGDRFRKNKYDCVSAKKGVVGYPISTSKKKRVCVVTYRHSGYELLKNSLSPRSNVNNL
jgi:hypothetical protein